MGCKLHEPELMKESDLIQIQPWWKQSDTGKAFNESHPEEVTGQQRRVKMTTF